MPSYPDLHDPEVPDDPDDPHRLGRLRRWFAGREYEVERIRTCLSDQGTRLAFYGPRRTGKSWVLERAVREARASGAWAAMFSVRSEMTPEQIGVLPLNALLQRGTPPVGDVEYQKRLRVLAGAEARLNKRVWMEGPQYRGGSRGSDTLFVAVLDAIEVVLAEHQSHVSLAIDEFPFLLTALHDHAGIAHRIKDCTRMSLVLSGSDIRLGQRFEDHRSPFHGAATPLRCSFIGEAFGPWIVERAGENELLVGQQAADAIVEIAGPNTVGIRELAEAVWNQCIERGEAEEADVHRVADLMVEHKLPSRKQIWNKYSRAQKDTLRAITAGQRADTLAPPLDQVAAELVSSGEIIETVEGEVVEDPWLRLMIKRNIIS